MIIFRADGNRKLGSGHVMRCLSIAEAARDLGVLCCFIVADNYFEEIIKNKGFECTVLETDYKDMEGELDKMKQIIKLYSPSHIFVDSYYVTRDYLKELRRHANIIYIDDLASFAYPADVLINYNIYFNVLDYEKIYKDEHTEMPRMLLGPMYAPLRKEFQNLDIKEQPHIVKNVLVLTGGADPEHVALRLAHYATHCYQDYVLHFVIGVMNSDVEEMKKAVSSSEKLVLHQFVQDMKSLMLSCDVAISAAGSTQYELCACGIPTINYIVADNQILGAEEFSMQGIMLCAGDVRYDKNFEENIFLNISRMDYEKRCKMSITGKDIVDGKGAERIVRYIYK